MDDTTAATAGFVAAGVAFAASLFVYRQPDLPGPEVAIPAGMALTGVAMAVFLLRRYGRIDRTLGTVVAGLASVGAVAVAGALLFWRAPWVVPTAMALAAGAGAVAAYADWLGLEREPLLRKFGATVKAVWIGGIGILAIFAWAVVVALVMRSVSPGGVSPQAGTVLSTLASGAGTLTVVVLYLQFSERDVSFLDIRWPGLRGLGYVVGGIVAILAGNISIGLLFQRAGVESASHTVVETAEAEPTILLVLIPLSYLIIAPGEELLYRNVVQKSLRESFSPVAGVVVASAVFAAVHLPAYSSPGASFRATLSTLAVIFVLALILGAIYERTKNVIVPILVHGTFNAIAFAVTYAQLTGALGG